MRTADIQIGGEYALGGYNGLRKVRVLEKGLPSPMKWNKHREGVRVEIVQGRSLSVEVVKSRNIDPWTSYHDKRMASEQAAQERASRVERVGIRLGIITAEATYGRRVSIYEDDFYALAERLGVDTT